MDGWDIVGIRNADGVLASQIVLDGPQDGAHLGCTSGGSADPLYLLACCSGLVDEIVDAVGDGGRGAVVDANVVGIRVKM